MCDRTDMWRVDERKGLVAAIMRYRGLKPFQCRACGYICYRRPKNEKANSAIA
jgi:hypothetical protein